MLYLRPGLKAGPADGHDVTYRHVSSAESPPGDVPAVVVDQVEVRVNQDVSGVLTRALAGHAKDRPLPPLSMQSTGQSLRVSS